MALQRVSLRTNRLPPRRRGDLTIDFDRHRVLRGEEEIRLTPKEFELLAFRPPRTALTHHTILTTIWGAPLLRGLKPLGPHH